MSVVLKEITNRFKLPTVTTGNIIFYIHNSLTSIIVLSLSLLTTAMENYGTPIKCMPDIDGDSISDDTNKREKYQDFFTTFCWMTSTYTVDEEDGDDRKYYRYYKWISSVLLSQAILFNIPKVIWDSVESGLMTKLTEDLKKAPDFKNIIIDFKLTLKRNKNYAVYYWLCEALCFVNVIVQIIFMDQLFDGEFLSYGWNVLTSWFHGETYDFMGQIFPRVTMCTFYKEGEITRSHDSVCILPLNAVNEKTFLFMWFWLVALLAMLFFLIVYRAVMIIFPKVRTRMFRNKLRCPDNANNVSTKLVDINNWWIVYLLFDNVDRDTWNNLVDEYLLAGGY